MKAMTDPMCKPLPPERPRPGRLTIRPWLLSLLAALLVACLGGCGKPPMLVNQYILEYPAPVMGGKAKIPAAVKVELFSVAQAFNTNAMVYQPQPFQSQVYNYSRWRANPGYLVTDYLIRDLRESGLFKAVFGPDSSGKYRFKLEGGVAEFQELDAADGWQASLALTVTLLDTTSGGAAPAGGLPEKLPGPGAPAGENPPGIGPGDEPGHGAGLGPDHQ